MVYNPIFDSPPLAGNEIVATNEPRGSTTTSAIAALAGGSVNISLKQTGVTANATLGTLAANGFIQYVMFRETAGHGVNVAIGSTSGASDVMSAVAVPASGTMLVIATGVTLDWFSPVSTQTLYVSSTSWNSASVNVQLVYVIGP